MAGARRSGSCTMAAAAGLATLEVYKEERLFDRCAELSPYWEQVMHGLKGTRHVIDIRNLGLIVGIELESRAGKPGARAYEAFRKAWDAGLLIRVTGDIIALSPPLIVEKHHIDRMAETLRKVLQALD